jgi:hypothetical protein
VVPRREWSLASDERSEKHFNAKAQRRKEEFEFFFAPLRLCVEMLCQVQSPRASHLFD